MEREGGLPKELSLSKRSHGSQDLLLENANLLKVFARVEPHRQEKMHALRKEVA